MDVARLRVLVEVAHAGSIAAAAQRMSFTPSALSQQLAKLEREVGSALLDRGPTGVRLTSAGEVLVQHGERVIGELRDAEVAVAAAAGRAPQRLAIGTFATAGKTLVPRALAALRRRHPAADLSLLDLEPPAGYGLVTSRDLDVLITHRYPGVALPDAAGLHRQRLLLDRLRLTDDAGRPSARGQSEPPRRPGRRPVDLQCPRSGEPDLPADARRRSGLARGVRDNRLRGDSGAGGGRVGHRAGAGQHSGQPPGQPDRGRRPGRHSGRARGPPGAP
nr:LysR family transcriptional regulator [Fodinicola feengrottensis]